jgi:UDPglucose 6-dehydrogenase
MRVGFMGLGRLGLPVATAMAARGIEVYGFDPHIKAHPDDTSHEAQYDETIAAAEDRLTFCENVGEVVRECDTIFVATQTPHAPEFEGVTPLTDERRDFDYVYLKGAIAEAAGVAERMKRHITFGVISTVLPGTMRREVMPILSGRQSLAYCPSFIAMGTTVRDFLDPEFVLLGGDPDGRVEAVFRHLNLGHLIRRMSIESAELAKVAYNCAIGQKIVLANTLMEICHKTSGADVDEVTGALKAAHRRLTSPAYMEAGMGDGGGCHPRDNIALSWLSRELDLSYDLFGAVMECREAQARWLADLMCEYDLPKGILGVSYKPSSHITTGSPALLVKTILEERGYNVGWFDPHVSMSSVDALGYRRVWLVGCRHPEFETLRLPKGSVVIDPWRYIPDQEGVEVVRVGEDERGWAAHLVDAPLAA